MKLHASPLKIGSSVMTTDPKSAAAWGNLAACLCELGQLGEARVAIDRAVALDPSDAINLSLRDRIHRQGQ